MNNEEEARKEIEPNEVEEEDEKDSDEEPEAEDSFDAGLDGEQERESTQLFD